MRTDEWNKRSQIILSGIPLEFCTVGKDENWRDQSCGSQTIHCRESWGCGFLRLGWGNRERRKERRERCVCTRASVCVHVCVWEKEIDSKQPSIVSFDSDCSSFVKLQVSISQLKRFHRSTPDSEMFKTFLFGCFFLQKVCPGCYYNLCASEQRELQAWQSLPPPKVKDGPESILLPKHL